MLFNVKEPIDELCITPTKFYAPNSWGRVVSYSIGHVNSTGDSTYFHSSASYSFHNEYSNSLSTFHNSFSSMASSYLVFGI